jgi:hypothetical protein
MSSEPRESYKNNLPVRILHSMVIRGKYIFSSTNSSIVQYVASPIAGEPWDESNWRGQSREDTCSKANPHARRPSQSQTETKNVCETSRKQRTSQRRNSSSNDMVRHTLWQSSNAHPTDATDRGDYPAGQGNKEEKNIDATMTTWCTWRERPNKVSEQDGVMKKYAYPAFPPAPPIPHVATIRRTKKELPQNKEPHEPQRETQWEDQYDETALRTNTTAPHNNPSSSYFWVRYRLWCRLSQST